MSSPHGATLLETAVGRSRFADAEVRVDGMNKVSGRTRYTADYSRPGTLWAAFAVSPYPHAWIVSIDTTAARAVPGVHAVITGEDCGRRRFGRKLFDYPVLAIDRVLFIGERVAAVAAETEEAAAEAARLIEVHYEELQPVLDTESAIASEAPVLHPDKASYYFDGGSVPLHEHANIQGKVEVHLGAAEHEPLFAGAYRTYEHVFQTPRQHHGYIEPHATLVWIDADGTVHVYSPCKSPFGLRDRLAVVADLERERIVVESSAIGGDFGGKGFTIDEFPCYFLARATGRPIKCVSTYVEELGAMNVRHASTVRLRTGVDRDGRFVVHRGEADYDGGAYAAGKPGMTLVPGGDLGFASVAYAIPDVHLQVRCLYTNSVPGGNMRSPADVQTLFAWESHVDLIAHDLGIDPLELRLRNAARPGDRTIAGESMYATRAVHVLERLRDELRAVPKLPPACGRGIAFTNRQGHGGATSIDLRVDKDGRLTAVMGVPDQGSGSATVVRRVIAAELGIAFEQIGIVHATTSEARLDPGAGASRVTRVVGGAAFDAARKLRTQLEARTHLEFREGAFVDHAGIVALTFAEAAARACTLGPIAVVGSCATHDDIDHESDFSCTAYAIDVAVDVETGALRLLDAILVVDVATIINPIAHQGQIDGGFIFGIGGALMEELPLESGKVTTLSLGDYKLPTIADIPPMRTISVHAPDATGPYGAKMAGEISNSGVAPAIANAVANAVGARLFTFPITAERVYGALHA